MPFGSNITQSGGRSAWRTSALAASLIVAVSACPVFAQSGAKKDSVGEEALDAVTQPLSDLNLRSKDIPPILLRAHVAPYDLEAFETCEALRVEVTNLNEVLGPDADEPEEAVGFLNRGLQAGGSMLGDMIPLRGIVRRVSGAKAEEAKWRVAIYAGVARRSYLKGFMKGLECQTAEEASIESAHDVLGLEPSE